MKTQIGESLLEGQIGDFQANPNHSLVYPLLEMRGEYFYYFLKMRKNMQKLVEKGRLGHWNSLLIE